MQLALPALVAALVCGQAPGPNYRTTNFVVQAETPEIAKLVAESAESRRKDLAKLWLDKEFPAWCSPCRIRVCVNMGRIAGCSDVSFSHGKVRSQQVDIQGPLDRILKGPLPHELTHVLFAHHFGTQPPKWADEGGAILSEDEYQGERQRKILRKFLIDEKCFSLRRLFAMQEYPANVPCFYAQAHSVCRFLVDGKGHKVFLAFMKAGMERGWDAAAVDHCGYKNVEQLERAWLTWAARVSETRKTSASAMTNAGSAEIIGSGKGVGMIGTHRLLLSPD
jgi:hypothetical protein